MQKEKSVFSKILDVFLKFVFAFFICIIVFNLLLFLSSLFSSSIIKENVKESASILLKEKNLYAIPPFYNVYNNNYTDAIMINMCYSIDNTNPVYSYMSARKNYDKELTKHELEDTKGELISFVAEDSGEDEYNPVKELYDFVDGKVYTSVEYARYWHGYMPFFRVLLIFFNVSEIRIFLLIVFIVLFICLLYLLYKRFGIAYPFIFGIPLIVYGYFYVSYSLESAPIFITMMLSSIILLLNIDRIKNIYLYLFIVACISNFVDFLTVPLITLAVPLTIYLIHTNKQSERTLKENIKTVVISCVAWGMGYGLTWGFKWLLFDVIFNKSLIYSSIYQVFYRTSRSNSIRNDVTVFDVLWELVYPYFGPIICYILALFISKKDINIKKLLHEIVPYVIIGLLPIVWYIVLANHTLIHVHFIYRHMLIFFIVIVLCYYKLLFTSKRHSDSSQKIE